MNKDLEIHEVQALILRALLFKQEAKFSELNKNKLSNDHFNFHVKKLVDDGVIEKTANDLYTLTTIGKEVANRLDTEKVIFERQAKIGALVVCIKEENRKKLYLIQQRLKQPSFGFHGFMTGKVSWGETLLETASRELMEETGLTADLTLKGIKHKMDYSVEGDLLEDKFFFVFRGDNTKGELVEQFEGGRNMWLTREEILKLPDLFDGVEDNMDIVEKGSLQFLENKYTLKKY
jgi:8-oxo-dGTP pyrophosphatase MutT (NUDIX family)